MNRLVKLGLIASCLSAAVSVAVAQDAPATPEQLAQQATELRQGLLKLMGWNMAPLGAMLKNKQPFDATVAEKSALRISQLAPMIPDVFQFDTRKAQVKTKAREGIWTNTADFNSKAEDLLKAATALNEAAKGGDKGTTLKAAAAVGKACGACHDNYRDK